MSRAQEGSAALFPAYTRSRAAQGDAASNISNEDLPRLPLQRSERPLCGFPLESQSYGTEGNWQSL